MTPSGCSARCQSSRPENVCLMALAVGDVLVVTTDDPAAVVDMPHFCAESGHSLIEAHENGETMIWKIRKSG